MGEHLSLELGSRYVHFRDVSLRVAEVGASRRLLAGGEAIAEVLFSRSDSATSCLMISPFSHFSALVGSPACAFANIATTARAVTTPMKMNTKLIIYAAFLACVVKAVVQYRNCALAGAAGHRLPRLLSRTGLCCVLVRCATRGPTISFRPITSCVRQFPMGALAHLQLGRAYHPVAPRADLN